MRNGAACANCLQRMNYGKSASLQDYNTKHRRQLMHLNKSISKIPVLLNEVNMKSYNNWLRLDKHSKANMAVESPVATHLIGNSRFNYSNTNIYQNEKKKYIQ